MKENPTPPDTSSEVRKRNMPQLAKVAAGQRPMTAEVNVSPLLTAEEVAARLRVKPKLVYSLARNGELPSVRVGQRRIRFRSESIERWIEATERKPAACRDGRIAVDKRKLPDCNRGASGTSLRRRANAPEPGIRRNGPDAS